jgi:large subunit ribosomal protein L5
MNRLKQKYNEEVKGKLTEELGTKNVHALPRLVKVVINMAVSEGKENASVIEKAAANVTVIAGQKAMITRAKKSISAFKLTEGQPIGVMATLRGEKMYAFLDKLINIVLPKVRDFRGVSDRSFDGQGNFNLGLREQILFPEVDYKTIDRLRGLQITINTSARNKEEGKKLLELLGMPFAKAA